MSGFTEYRASGAHDRANSHEVVLTLETSRAMLPLVERIVADILSSQSQLSELYPECDQLERNRRALSWPERARRYQLLDDVVASEGHLREALTELDALGLTLLDSEVGTVGFPTRVNNRDAYFCWQPDAPGIEQWAYAGSTIRHPIPASWLEQESPASRAPRKGRRKSE